MNDTSRKLISIVMPAYNEELLLPQAYERVTETMKQVCHDYEVLLVDNDSSDRTPELAAEFCRRDPRWRYLKFSRNFMAETSLAAGLTYASGDAVIFLFSDLQDPPEKIPEFVRRWEEGNEVVLGVHLARHGDPWWRNQAAAVAYKLIRWLADVDIPTNAGDFRLLDRRVVDVLKLMTERSRYLRGMGSWVGFRKTTVEYERQPRAAGESKCPLLPALQQALTGALSFSVKPLHLLFVFGLAVMSAAILLEITVLMNSLIPSLKHMRGLTSIHCLLLANIGFTALSMGLVGEYVGHIYVESKRRPLWVVDRTINLDIPSDQRYGGMQ